MVFTRLTGEPQVWAVGLTTRQFPIIRHTGVRGRLILPTWQLSAYGACPQWGAVSFLNQTRLEPLSPKACAAVIANRHFADFLSFRVLMLMVRFAEVAQLQPYFVVQEPEICLDRKAKPLVLQYTDVALLRSQAYPQLELGRPLPPNFGSTGLDKPTSAEIKFLMQTPWGCNRIQTQPRLAPGELADAQALVQAPLALMLDSIIALDHELGADGGIDQAEDARLFHQITSGDLH